MKIINLEEEILHNIRVIDKQFDKQISSSCLSIIYRELATCKGELISIKKNIRNQIALTLVIK